MITKTWIFHFVTATPIDGEGKSLSDKEDQYICSIQNQSWN